MPKNLIKIMHEQLGLASGSPIIVKWCDYDYFKYPWHFHAEYEIVYIIHSTGIRFTGNNIEDFSDEDLVLFGTFLPHMYRNDNTYYQNNPELRVHAIVVQFSSDFFSHAMGLYPEFHKIKALLESARQGVYFNKEGNDEIRKRLRRLVRLSGLNRLLECLKILSLMSVTPHKRMLGSETPGQAHTTEADLRLSKVLGQLNRDYDKPIRLEEIARTSGMSPSAFCRYFREKSGKTMIAYVNELRIGYACKLLLAGEMTISQICYECGYNNISNFNRQFKKITRFIPTEYIKVFREDKRPIVVGKD